jgi:hypothetical protein
MEHVSGIKLKTILLHNGNWWKFFLKHHKFIRHSIIVNVLKTMACGTSFLGFHFAVCPTCHRSKKIFHSCKSRFCSPCGKKATDIWIKNSFNSLPDTKWQHFTFTMPNVLWDFFWVNRYLMNKIPAVAAGIIKQLSLQKQFIPGMYLAIHTFGRDLKRNFHIHLSSTVGGLSLTHDRWIPNAYFYHDTLKKMWRYEILTLLRKEFKQGKLKLPPALNHIRSYTEFCAWTALLYEKTWVVHLNKQSDNPAANILYLGRYLKRPPISETRIQAFDGNSVTYTFLDHYTDTVETMTLPVMDFIARLIAHIPDAYFRNIRYYGFLSNRTRTKLLPIVYNLLNETKDILAKKIYIPWRQMIKNTFHYDPLACKVCGAIMTLCYGVFPKSGPITQIHKEIANGYFQLL